MSVHTLSIGGLVKYRGHFEFSVTTFKFDGTLLNSGNQIWQQTNWGVWVMFRKPQANAKTKENFDSDYIKFEAELNAMIEDPLKSKSIPPEPKEDKVLTLKGYIEKNIFALIDGHHDKAIEQETKKDLIRKYESLKRRAETYDNEVKKFTQKKETEEARRKKAEEHQQAAEQEKARREAQKKEQERQEAERREREEKTETLLNKNISTQDQRANENHSPVNTLLFSGPKIKPPDEKEMKNDQISHIFDTIPNDYWKRHGNLAQKLRSYDKKRKEQLGFIADLKILFDSDSKTKPDQKAELLHSALTLLLQELKGEIRATRWLGTKSRLESIIDSKLKSLIQDFPSSNQDTSHQKLFNYVKGQYKFKEGPNFERLKKFEKLNKKTSRPKYK